MCAPVAGRPKLCTQFGGQLPCYCIQLHWTKLRIMLLTSQRRSAHIKSLYVHMQCLEAEFYSWVAYGKGIASLDSSLAGKGSPACSI